MPVVDRSSPGDRLFQHVTLAGDLQSELGCPRDWQPECVTTDLAFDPTDGQWHATFTVRRWKWCAALSRTRNGPGAVSHKYRLCPDGQGSVPVKHCAVRGGGSGGRLRGVARGHSMGCEELR